MNSAEDFGFLEANLRVIEAHYPGLAAQLMVTDDLPEADIRLETAASGAPTLIVRGIHVHSPRDPVREGLRLGENLTGDGPVIVLGFGLGYAAEAAAAAAPNRPLIVVERRPLILKKAFECRDLRPFLTGYKVIFVLGGSGEAGVNALTGALRLLENGNGKAALVRNRALLNLDEEWYAAAEGRINTWSSRDDVNTATLRRFGKRWVRNLAVNSPAIRDLPGVSRLEGCLAPIRAPVLLVAAGPSLDNLAPLLPELAERAVVVAVDTSQRLLLSHGAAPDFTVVVDPQYWNARHLDRAPAPNTCLIAESAVYPPVFREPWARAFLCSSLFPLGRFIEDRLDPKGNLGAGGSVATTAWDFARILGGDSLWIAGLDLAYPNLKTHFRGALFETRSLSESRRFTPAETWSVRALRDGHPFKAPSASGGTVLTDKRLSLYASWFEYQFRRGSETKNYNLSPEGLHIPGFPARPVEELLALPPMRAEINSRLAETFARIDTEFNSPAEKDARAARYKTACGGLLRGLETLQTLAAESAELAEKARPPDRDRLLQRLGEVNRLIMESEVKDVAGFLFPPLAELEAGLKTTGPYARYRELSAKLYRSLAETTEYHLNILSRY
ncbi:hypothetical protein AGMMS4952_13570 [Spirochaetia bacterium]|nr:hypothetical protein AGMMS4952_13570 [Spirochaetia bacterium]